MRLSRRMNAVVLDNLCDCAGDPRLGVRVADWPFRVGMTFTELVEGLTVETEAVVEGISGLFKHVKLTAGPAALLIYAEKLPNI